MQHTLQGKLRQGAGDRGHRAYARKLRSRRSQFDNARRILLHSYRFEGVAVLGTKKDVILQLTSVIDYRPQRSVYGGEALADQE
jgi:hypothetical protein